MDTVTLQDLSPAQFTKHAPKDIPIETIIELRKKSLSTRQIAKILGCDHSNIVRRLNAYKAELQGIEPFKRNRADIFAVVQSKIINNITEKDIQKASLLQKTTAISQLYDKERLERGLSVTEGIIDVLLAIHQSLFPKQVGANSDNIIDVTPDNEDPVPPTSDIMLNSVDG